MLAFLLTGCAHGTPAPTVTASPVAPKTLPIVGVSLPDVATTDTTLIQKGLADNQRKNDVTLLYRSADGKAEKQANDIADFVRLNVVGLVVFPVDAILVGPAIAAAREKGIPVLAINMPPIGTAVDALIRPDFRANGREAARFVAEKSSSHGPALILAADSDASADFVAGAQEGLAKASVTTETLTVGGPANVPGVVTAAVRERGVRAIIAADDSLALTAMVALRDAGLLSGVDVIGHGGTREAIQAILDGMLAGDVDTRPQDLGVAAVNGIAALTRKKQPPSHLIVRINGIELPVTAVAGRLITRDNARDMQERWPDLIYATATTATPTVKP